MFDSCKLDKSFAMGASISFPKFLAIFGFSKADGSNELFFIDSVPSLSAELLRKLFLDVSMNFGMILLSSFFFFLS